MANLVGKSILHYRIMEHVGQGGMGIVYKAEDTRLKRYIAIKFLPDRISASEERRERFKIEAQAAAALNHPNIATIHTIEDFENEIFIVMEFIEGQELNSIIDSRQLSIDETVNYALQIGEGLKAAHEKGVVHRDIKTSNIMVTESGQIKIMDFGLAKVAGQTQITRTGNTMGTVAYMSPEQIKEGKVDHRTDVWAFGVVLYEMLTGQLPFAGDYQQTVMYSILHKKPIPAEKLRKDIPEALRICLNKMLQKDVNRRCQSVEKILTQLRTDPGTSPFRHSKEGEILGKRIRTFIISGLVLLTVMVTIVVVLFWQRPDESFSFGDNSGNLIRIAILPFDNISANANDEYLADGMTDAMISKLSKIENFRVIARTSVMRYKESTKNVADIGNELGVRLLLEGSVRRMTNDLRISAQLVDVITQTSIWSDEYRVKLDDIFDIQDRVSRSIVGALELQLSHQEERRLAERPISNIRAYESYLRARQAMWSFDIDATRRAEREIQNALEIVGDNELLNATLGWLYLHAVEAGLQSPEDSYQKAEELAAKVLESKPNSSYGLALRGKIYNRRGNIQESVRDLTRAHSIDPNNPDVLLQLSYNYIRSGNGPAASPLLERLLAIDPLTPLSYNIRGFQDCMNGRFDLGLEYYRKMYELDPESPGVRLFYAWCLAGNNNIQEACSILDLLAKDSPQNVLAQLGLFFMHSLLGKKEQALRSLTPELNTAAKKVEYLSRVMAASFALISVKEEAVNWMENAVNLGFIHYPYLAERSPFLVNIRDEALFKRLLQKVKYKWENFEI